MNNGNYYYSQFHQVLFEEFLPSYRIKDLAAIIQCQIDNNCSFASHVEVSIPQY